MPAHLRALPLAGVAAALAAVLGGCGGSTDPIAQFETVTYTSSVYALNGTPIGVPTAVNTVIAATVRVEPTYDFDVAFDLDAQGRVVLITQRLVGRPLGFNGHPVALQIVTGSFDSFVEAPRNGWVNDSTLTVQVGQLIAIRSQPPTCQLNFGASIYSKMIVDSVDVPNRRMWLTTLTDPNCGFRGLATGRPRF